MKLAARISAGALERQLARLAGELEAAALDALAKELEAARRDEGHPMQAAAIDAAARALSRRRRPGRAR